MPQKKKQPPPPPPEPESDEEDFDDYDNMVDETKEWQCLHCTYLNSLEAEICEMCAKSRRSVASSRAEDEEEFVSGNSQLDDPYESEEEEIEEFDKIQCPKCTFLNQVDLKTCTICGASLHKPPIKNGRRPTSAASKSSSSRR